MVISIVSEFHWSIHDIDNLYIDEMDYYGLIFWYNHISKQVDKLKKK